jgi:hypothetical protein
VTGALLAAGAVRAADPAQDALVMLGPAGDLKAQIRYLTTTWPDQHAIAVVTTEAPARCGAGSADKVYCTQWVRLNESVLIRWLEADPQAPGDGFAIHYWFDAGRSAIEIAPGEELLVFLAPTHAQGTYACTVLTRTTGAALGQVREALRRLEGR